MAPFFFAKVNLCYGYYNAHTNLEYIKFKELHSTIKKVQIIINNHNKANYYDLQDTDDYNKILKK